MFIDSCQQTLTSIISSSFTTQKHDTLPDYAANKLDTNKLNIILRQSVNQHGTINASEIKIEWVNYKQSTFDYQ